MGPDHCRAHHAPWFPSASHQSGGESHFVFKSGGGAPGREDESVGWFAGEEDCQEAWNGSCNFPDGFYLCGEGRWEFHQSLWPSFSRCSGGSLCFPVSAECSGGCCWGSCGGEISEVGEDAEARKVTRKKASVLSESEEEEEEEYIEEAEPEEQAEGSPAPLVEKAVLQLTKIVGSLAKKKKGSKDLDLCLDAAQEGGAVESSSSQSSSRSKAAAYKRLRGALTEQPGLLCQAIEDAMEEDFAQLRAAPGSAALPISTRGWIEHRSRLQYYQNTIRFAWILGGIHDALRQNRLEEAKARTLLAITGLDQASLDGGSWALSQEILLEAPPPFSSFAGKKLPEAWEQATSKLLDDRWAEVLMWRLRDRDQFVEARKRLQSGRVSNPPPVRDPQNPGDRDPKPKKTPKPKGGKGGGKSSEEDPRPVAN